MNTDAALSDVARNRRVDAEPIHPVHRDLHVRPPSNAGIPRHIAVRAFFAARASRSPLAVALKYRFALPPRRAVGSPNLEVILNHLRNRHPVGVLVEPDDREQHQ
jgi:hypothetical protein